MASSPAITKTENFQVVYLGENGFPIGFGAIQKLIMVSKALIEEGADVTVINRKGNFDPDKPVNIALQGNFEGIDYVYTSRSIYRPKGFFKRNIQKVKGIYKEFQYLRKLRKNDQLDAGIISCYHLGQVTLYRLYGYFLKFPVVYNYVEMAQVLDNRRALSLKINDYLFERFLIPSMDGAFPISEVLVNHYKKIAPNKKMLKLPILCEFEKFDIKVEKQNRDFFLFCGALSYQETIDFVLDAYDLLPKDNPVDLHLILGGGTDEEYQKLLTHIKKLKKGSQIKVFHNVRHSEIPKHYKPAKGLLIPMRPTLQDAARFPHKIGEYVASGNPMISNNFGEVACYFKDGETALVAETYTIEDFASKMKFVLDNPEVAKRIGEQGKILGLKAFNHLTYGPKILAFLKALAR
ncbi:MAG: glycosyltransferase involved in cell wall biosynthesis [Saprospiraceae bacterium]|jgi:glycosyltransferase involved in cell wall biosynthesis